jgi:crossover junction endodeoxyribonuclease RuvC
LRVLGVDPGSRFTGYGVVDQQGGRLRHVAHGVIKPDGQATLALRLEAIFRGLSQAVEAFRPDALAVEGVFTARNARSALILGHARAMPLLLAAQRGLPVHEYAPARVKKAVGASGGADKDAVARMVKTFLRLDEVERADASDALAVAICHLNHCLKSAVIPLPTGSRRRAQSGFGALADRLRPAFERPATVRVVPLRVLGRKDER